nr:unnamed protein product [Callosobruchus analis]
MFKEAKARLMQPLYFPYHGNNAFIAYEDDVVILTRSKRQLGTVSRRFEKEASLFGPATNEGKDKYMEMRVGASESQRFIEIEVVKQLERVIARHSKLYENSSNNDFGIDKYKRSKILDKIADIKLSKLSKGEFEKGIENLTQFNVEQAKQQSYGKIYYVNVNGHDIPAVYDLLCELLLHSDPETASKSFHEATEFYYCKLLSKHGVTEDEFLLQVKLFLPYAKLERLYQCTPEDTQRAALEVEECILYPELSREQCFIVLRNVYRSSEASLIRFDLIPAQDVPGNLGEYFKVKLVAKYEGTIKTHHLFAKLIKAPDYSIAFKKERVFFEGIMKSYMDIGLDKLTDFCPKCYFASNNMLLSDDISISGYDSTDFSIPVTLKWLATSIKVLAKFHAASIIFEEKLSKRLGRTVRINTEYPDAVQETLFSEAGEEKGLRPDMIRSVHGFILSEADAFQSSLDYDTLKQRVEAVCSTIPRFVKKSDKVRNVLNHANVMYKEDKDTEAASAYFIDFQMLRYAPPSMDIMFLIFVNADRLTRLEHLTDLIQLYYKELTQILCTYSIDIDMVFSLDDLVKSCKEVEAIIICISLIYSRFLLLSKEQKQKLLRRSGTSNNKEEDTPGLETTPVQGPVMKRVTERHSKLCENSLNNPFGIDKYKRSKILDKIADIKLRKLDKGEFEKGIERVAQFNVEQVKQQSVGKIYYVNVNGHDIPAVYDLLCEILLHSDSESASKSFHEATELYFSKVLSKYSVTEDEFRMQVKLFLPYAKLERLYQCKSADTQRAALEMEECILYPELSREQCYIALRNLYKSTQASLIRFDVIPAQDLPGNFGEYFKVKIVASYEGTIKTHHLFAKLIKILGDFGTAVMKKLAFFERIMKSYLDIGLAKLTDFCPNCYFTSNNMLLFDDLSIRGYDSVDFNKPVTLKWLATSVKVLAKFHAASIIFEEKLGKKLGRTVRIDTEYPDAVRESMFEETEEGKGLRPDMIRNVLGFISSEADTFQTSLDDGTLKQRVEVICSTIPRYVKKSDKIRNVLNHGDLWGAYIVDFQMLRYAPPSLDIMFLVFLNADRCKRLEHLTDLIELYYKELTQILCSYGIDMDVVFSLDDLVKSCEEVEAIIICISLMYSRFLLLSKEQRQELLSSTGSNNKEEDPPGLEMTRVQGPVMSRIRGLLQDLVKICEKMT